MFPAPKVPLVLPVPMVNPAPLVLPAPTDNPVNLVAKDLPEMLDPMVHPETQVATEKTAPMEKLALAENAVTVLPLVPLPAIKPQHNLKEADPLLKAWLPSVESTNSLFPFLYLVIVIFGEVKNRLGLGSLASS